MNTEHVDDLVKRLTTARLTRLEALRGLLASAVVGLTGVTRAEETAAKKQTKRGKKHAGKQAHGNGKQPCSGKPGAKQPLGCPCKGNGGNCRSKRCCPTAGGSSGTCCPAEGTTPTVPPPPTPLKPFGAACTSSTECASGLCVCLLPGCGGGGLCASTDIDEACNKAGGFPTQVTTPGVVTQFVFTCASPLGDCSENCFNAGQVCDITATCQQLIDAVSPRSG